MSRPDSHVSRSELHIAAATEGLAHSDARLAGALHAHIATAHAVLGLAEVMDDLRGRLASIETALRESDRPRPS